MTKPLTPYERERRAAAKAARLDPDYATQMADELQLFLVTMHRFTFQTITSRTVGVDSWQYRSYYEFVLERGRQMPSASRPSGTRKQPNRQCFSNALHLALTDRTLTYVEGFACAFQSIPTEHAWCINAEGHVVDPTWEWPELASYFGIEMPISEISPIISRNRVYGVLVNDWRNDHAILKTGRITHELEATS